jgi:peptide/nickel transport system permease protein
VTGAAKFRRLAAAGLYSLILPLLAAGFLATILITLAPGFGVDERELDNRFSAEGIANIRKRGAPQRNVIISYFSYLKGVTHGDLGMSRTFDRPVLDLLKERAAVTGVNLALGLSLGWGAGLILASSGMLRRLSGLRPAWVTCSGAMLCIPSALAAFAVVLINGPAGLAVAVAICPRIFRYADNLFRASGRRAHVLCARAKGLSDYRVLVNHIYPAALPELIALAGVSVNIALGAVIPVEVFCDKPGLGQLAWKAALGRDLPLLVNITLMVTAITLVANRASDMLIHALGSPSVSAGVQG